MHTLAIHICPILCNRKYTLKWKRNISIAFCVFDKVWEKENGSNACHLNSIYPLADHSANSGINPWPALPTIHHPHLNFPLVTWTQQPCPTGSLFCFSLSSKPKVLGLTVPKQLLIERFCLFSLFIGFTQFQLSSLPQLYQRKGIHIQAMC